jgi:hypothetical protein
MTTWKLIGKAWIVDNTRVIQWIAAAAARGIAWFLAGKLGIEAAQSNELGTALAEALAALVVAGIAIYTSVKGRGKLLATPPPTKR